MKAHTFGRLAIGAALAIVATSLALLGETAHLAHAAEKTLANTTNTPGGNVSPNPQPLPPRIVQVTKAFVR